MATFEYRLAQQFTAEFIGALRDEKGDGFLAKLLVDSMSDDDWDEYHRILDEWVDAIIIYPEQGFEVMIALRIDTWNHELFEVCTLAKNRLVEWLYDGDEVRRLLEAIQATDSREILGD